MRKADPPILQNVIPETKMPNPIVNTDDQKDRGNFELNPLYRYEKVTRGKGKRKATSMRGESEGKTVSECRGRTRKKGKKYG